MSFTCYDENGGYGHPDHIQVHLMTVAAFHAAGDATQYPDSSLAPWQPQKLYYTAYPVPTSSAATNLCAPWGLRCHQIGRILIPTRWSGIPDEAITTRVDVRDYVGHKLEALNCHRTQIAPGLVV